MRIAITGGAGFIGHNLALYLAGRGYSVTVIDTLERATPQAVRRLSEAGIPVLRVDARDLQGLLSIVRGVDYVVHSAAYVSVGESMERPEVYMDNNVQSTLSVARACLKAGVPVLYFSSAAVYGEPVKLPIPEDHPLKPLSPYGLSKLFGEEILELYSRQGLKYIALRLFNVYGPGQSPSYAGVVSRFIECALRGSKLVIYGDGLQTRDFIHVVDVARAVELAIQRQVYGEVLNIGSGKPVSIRELAEVVRKHACPECPVEHQPPRPGEIRHSHADISRARRILGYQPTITLEEGVRELVEYYSRENTTL